MSASAIAPLGSVQREATQPATQIQQQDISNLAYALWHCRDCSEGSPEQDWFEAEQRVRFEAFIRYRDEVKCRAMLHHTDHGRFLTDNRQFDTPTGQITASILNILCRSPVESVRL